MLRGCLIAWGLLVGLRLIFGILGVFVGVIVVVGGVVNDAFTFCFS